MLYYGFFPIPQVALLEVNSSIYWNYMATEAYRMAINDPPP